MRPFEQARHAAGLCIQCGDQKPDHYLRCARCRGRVNERSVVYYQQVTRPERLAERRRLQTNFNHA